MSRTFAILAFVVCVIFSSAAAQAACGGGGYSQPKKVVYRQESTPATTTYQEVPASYETRQSNLDTSRFDAISGTLDLSDNQRKDIDNAKRKVGKMQLSSADSKREFDQRLTKILTWHQMETYTSSEKNDKTEKNENMEKK